MKDVLSQSEIDQLISSMGKGEIDLKDVGKKSKEIRSYDFKKPKKLSHEQSKTLLEMHNMFARYLTPTLSTMLRSYCNAQVQFAEEQTYFEYINSLPVNGFLCTVPFLSGTAFLEFSNIIVNVLLDRILGGKGDVVTANDTFSNMEYQLMKRIIKQIIPGLNESWSDVSKGAFGMEIDMGGHYDNMYSPNEITVIISLMVKIGKVEGYVNICIPYLLIEPVIKKLNRKNIAYGNLMSKNKISLKDYMRNRVFDSHVEIKGMLGSTRILFQQASALKVGDVIKLDDMVKKGVHVMIGGRGEYQGILGMQNGNYAIKIQQLKERKEVAYGNNDAGSD